MSRKGAFEVDGVKELRAALRGMDVSLQDFRVVNAKVSQFVGARGAQMAPRRSGMLAATWRPSNATTYAAVRFGGANVPYANAVHWGTGPRLGRRGPHNITPNLFAVNAAHQTEPVWGDWYMTFIDDVMRKWDLE